MMSQKLLNSIPFRFYAAAALGCGAAEATERGLEAKLAETIDGPKKLER